LWFKPLDHSFFIFPFCTTTHPAHAHFSCILALQGHQKRAPFVHSFSTRVELCYSLKTLCCGSISSIACELIYLTTNGLLCAYFPLSGGHRDGTIDTQREHSWCFCVKGKPRAFFFYDPPTLCIFARAHLPVPRPKGSFSGGRMAPTLSPLLVPVLCSCSTCWWCCCWYFVVIAPLVASQLRPIVSSPSHSLSRCCVFIFPSQVATGKGPSTLNVSTHDVFV
jgi:hypothetical protein